MKIKQIGTLEKEAFSPTVIPDIYCIDLSMPITVQYEVSGDCNQRCIFCYNVWKGESVSTSTSITLSPEKRWQVIEKIIALDVFEVILSGGEPLFIPEICEMVFRLAEEDIKTYLITNGTLLTQDTAYRLREAGLDGIQISLHGSDAKIHEGITKIPGSFNKTITGIKNAVEFFSSESISINMVLVKNNYTNIGSMMRMLNKMGNLCFSIGFLSETGLAISADIGIRKDLILESFRTVMKISRELNMSVGISGGFPFCLFPLEEQEQVMRVSANICDAGLNQMVISSSGEIRPCVCLPQVLGNILNDDPWEIWKNAPFLQFLRRFEHIPLVCHSCDLVSVCKGGCRAAAYYSCGDFQSIDPIIGNEGGQECQKKKMYMYSAILV